MSRILSLLKAAAGQIPLTSPLGRWATALSNEADQGGAVAAQDVWNCSASVQVNDVVHVSGADTVNQALDSGDASSQMPAIGFVTSKPSPTTCVVQYSGKLPNVFSGLIPGTLYYVSATQAGKIVPANTIFPGTSLVQQVGVARTTTELVAQIATV
jgi:hypothetical protein